MEGGPPGAHPGIEGECGAQRRAALGGGRPAHLKSLLTKMEIESQRKRGEEKEGREGVVGWELMEGEGRKGGS